MPLLLVATYVLPGFVISWVFLFSLFRLLLTTDPHFALTTGGTKKISFESLRKIGGVIGVAVSGALVFAHIHSLVFGNYYNHTTETILGHGSCGGFATVLIKVFVLAGPLMGALAAVIVYRLVYRKK